MWRGMAVCYLRKDRFTDARKAIEKSIEVFKACDNAWELSKTYVEGAKEGLFAPAEIKAKLEQAREFFQEFEHPAWEKKVLELLEGPEFSENGLPLRVSLEIAERQKIVEALSEAEGIITLAAERLGVSYQTLQYKIKRYKIER